MWCLFASSTYIKVRPLFQNRSQLLRWFRVRLQLYHCVKMRKLEQESRLKRFKKTLYDPETKKILGRDGKNWALIFIFYVIAYALLLGFSLGMISVFMYGCITTDKPTLTGMHSILKMSPGMAYQPKLSVITSFNQFTSYQSTMNDRYIELASNVLKRYDNFTNNADCTSGVDSGFPDVPCRFQTSSLGLCANPETALLNGGPCFYLKVNKIFGWLPDLANKTDTDKILISCTGQNPVDTLLLGEPVYYPSITGSDGKTYGYIDTTFFPFINQPGYQTPLTAVQFPNVRPSTVVLAECTMHGLANGGAGVLFELCVDGRS